tara:strand:- start:43 stop:252 length:210 start_codon:yes stop_codon:yes gene_type:complete
MRNVKMVNIKYPHYKCGMCRENFIKKPRYRWTGIITKEELYICRNCAYREAYGSKNRSKAKREKLLENE